MSKRNLNQGRVILTGASSGIGRALAVALAKQGCRLVLLARRKEKLLELQQEIATFSKPGSGGSALSPADSSAVSSADSANVDEMENVKIVVGDVTDDNVRQQTVQTALDSFGGVDILINNAGIGAFGLFEKADSDRFLQVLDVNLVSVVEMIRLTLPHLIDSAKSYKATRKGCVPMIVNTSSIMGKRGAPYSSEYSAAKFGIQGFSESLRAELSVYGIDVLVVCPGTTKTEFFDSVIDNTGMAKWPSHRPVSPDYVAGQMIRAMKRGTHEIVPYFWARVLCWLCRLSPGLVDRIMCRYV